MPLEDEDRRLFGLCQSLNFITKGLFDPTTLPISLLWDFKKKSPEIPSDDKIKRAIELVGWKKVVLKQDEVFLPLPGMGLDFGGFGKEYAVDRVIEILKSCGVENAMVNFGGDIHALGCPKNALNWIIGIENPKEPGRPAFCFGAQRHGGSHFRYLCSFFCKGRKALQSFDRSPNGVSRFKQCFFSKCPCKHLPGGRGIGHLLFALRQ